MKTGKMKLRIRRNCCSQEAADKWSPMGTEAGHHCTVLSIAAPNPITQHESMSPSSSSQQSNAKTGSGTQAEIQWKLRVGAGLNKVLTILFIPGKMTKVTVPCWRPEGGYHISFSSQFPELSSHVW